MGSGSVIEKYLDVLELSFMFFMHQQNFINLALIVNKHISMENYTNKHFIKIRLNTVKETKNKTHKWMVYLQPNKIIKLK